MPNAKKMMLISHPGRLVTTLHSMGQNSYSEKAVVLGPGTALVWTGFISVITWVSVLRGIFFFLLDLSVSAFPDITIFF